ncbi:MAG: FG-GAP repeat domain-containing protein [Pirellulaceae bacterium]
MANDGNSSSRWRVILLLVMMFAIGVPVYLLLKPQVPPPIPMPDKSTDSEVGAAQAILAPKEIERAIAAAALLENNQPVEAIEAYKQLVQDYPKVSSFRRNLAIGWLNQVETLAKRASDPAEDREAIRKQIPDALEAAEAAAQQAIATQPDQPASYQIAVAVARQRIAQLPLVADELRKELLGRLESYLQKSPGNPALALAFYETSEELSTQDPEVLQKSIQPLADAFALQPRNLFLAKILSERLFDARDPRLIAILQTAQELAKPFSWQMEPILGEKDPIGYLDRGIALVKEEKWDEATEYVLPWLNTLGSTSGFKPDNRLLAPATLALVDLRDIERAVRARAVTEVTAAADSQRKAPQSKEVLREGVESQAALVRWWDWDVDTFPEVAWTDAGMFRVARWIPDSKTLGEVLSEFPIPEGTTQWKAIDLYESQYPPRPTVPNENRRTAIRQRQPDWTDDQIDQLLGQRHDTLKDLVFWGPAGIRVVPTQSDPKTGTIQSGSPIVLPGTESLLGVRQLEVNDWDADGDLDLLVLGEDRLWFLVNLGDRTFRDTHADQLLSGMPRPVGIAFCDIDRDVDADVLVSGDDGKTVGLLENLLHGQFRYRSLEGPWSSLAGKTLLLPVEWDGNVSWDWLASGSAQPMQLLTTSTDEQGKVAPRPAKEFGLAVESLRLGDLDNDAQIDWIGAGAEGLVCFRGGKTELLQQGVASDVAIADADRDGLLDVLAVVDGKLHWWGDFASPDQPFAQFRVKGIADTNGGGRINNYALGGLLEVYSTGRYQAAWIEDDVTHFGLGKQGDVVNARILFNNGLTQNIFQPPTQALVEEVQAPKGSCPFVYGFDGQRWQFITDLCWNAPLGLQIAKGKPLPDRAWEYLLLPGRLVQPVDGVYGLRVTEELWEAAYMDTVQIVALDHPADVEVFTNEKVGPAEIAEPRVWAFRDLRPIHRVVDGHGKDCTQLLQHADGRYAVPFQRRICQGLVEPTRLDLELAQPLLPSSQAQLILNGWIFPTDTSLNIAIDQNPTLDPPQPPTLWARDGTGDWKEVLPFMGFPGGKPKSIVIDLTGKLPFAVTALRIEGSQEIYWDRMALAVDQSLNPNDSSVLVRQPMELLSGELRFRGVSRMVIGSREQPHGFDYEKKTNVPAWPPMQDGFTRYGDVTKWIRDRDGDLVVMGSGDEIDLRFQAPKQLLREGWQRDFQMHNVGWDKDADLSTLEGQSTLPLPFEGMGCYPPSAGQWRRAEEVLKRHEDVLTRRQSTGAFWTQSSQPSPTGRGAGGSSKP